MRRFVMLFYLINYYCLPPKEALWNLELLKGIACSFPLLSCVYAS